MSGLRLRVGVFAGVVLLAVAGVVVYLRQAVTADPDGHTPAAASVDTGVAPVVAGAHVVFRSTAPGDGYGRVAVVPVDAPSGPRAFTPASCERVHAVRGTAVCLVALRGLATTYRVKILGPQWTPVSERAVPGLPSRARLSSDGALTATTTFVYGDSYASPGQFSTRTLIGPTGGADPVDVEQFTLRVDGRPVTAVDRNVWGVTFADDDRFYATAASGGRTWLVEGSRSGRTLTALRRTSSAPRCPPTARASRSRNTATCRPGGGASPSSTWPAGGRHRWRRPAASTTRRSGSTTTRSCTGCPATRTARRRATSGPCPPTAPAHRGS